MHDYGIKTTSIVYIVMADFMKEEKNNMKDKKKQCFSFIFCASLNEEKKEEKKQNELDEHWTY